VNDEAHQRQGLGEGQAQRLAPHQDRALQERAFRRAVARRFYAQGQDTKQIADEMKVDESLVYNVLDMVRRERINA